MNRCPNCNNTLSSSDVLCPKCGAMVEEINTKLSVNKKFADIPSTGNSESTTIPDHYENIIMYNESFPIKEPEPPAELEELETGEEPEDFDIENIISHNGDSSHVNPLLAHLEKQRSSMEEKPVETDETEPEEEILTEPEEEILPEPEEEAEKIADMIPDEPEFTGDDETDDEPVSIVEEPEYSTEPVAMGELQQIAKQLSGDAEPAKQSTESSEDAAGNSSDGFPIDGVPSYSKAYLDAIRNIDISDEELDEGEFDPNAFMEEFRKSKNKQPEPEAEAEPEASPEPESEPQIAEEPVRRRYNPDRPKSKNNEEELLKEKEKLLEEARRKAEEEAKRLEEETKRVQEEARLKAEEEAKLKAEEENKKAEESKASKEDEALELDLDPGRFFMPEGNEVQADSNEEFLSDDEEFIIEEDENSKPLQPLPQQQINRTEEYTAAEAQNESTILDRVDSSANYDPDEKKEKKRLPVWAAVLIWIAVAGGIFFGAYTLDKHVRKTYSGYNEYIYEMTEGKIDLESMSN